MYTHDACMHITHQVLPHLFVCIFQHNLDIQIDEFTSHSYSTQRITIPRKNLYMFTPIQHLFTHPKHSTYLDRFKRYMRWKLFWVFSLLGYRSDYLYSLVDKVHKLVQLVHPGKKHPQSKVGRSIEGDDSHLLFHRLAIYDVTWHDVLFRSYFVMDTQLFHERGHLLKKDMVDSISA